MERVSHQPGSRARVSKVASVLCAITLLGLLVVPAPLIAQSTEIVRGRITGSDGAPIPDVTVTITGLQSQATLTAHTTDKGIFTALFPNAEGDYLVSARKIGYAPYNTRVTRTGLSSVLVADMVMSNIAMKLDTVRINTSRAVPTPGQASVGGIEQNLLQGALFSLDPSDLLSLAGQIPGIVGDSSGYSVLGAGAGANNGTIDGAKFGGNNVPQDAVGGSRVIQTSADPRVAGFSGAQTATFLRGGSDIFSLTARGTFGDSHLAWTDPAWPNPVPTLGTVSGGVGGPIIKKKLHYMFSWNARDNTADVYSLLQPPEAIISQYGFTSDTIAAVSHALGQLGVPLTLHGLPDNQQSHSYNTSTVLDWTPTATTSLRLTQNGYWSEFGSPGRAPTSYPTLGSHSDNSFQFISAKLTGYVHGFLDEVNSTLNYSQNNNSPYAELPGASVRVGTVFDDGHTGLGSLQFGGGSGVDRNTNYDWDTQNEFSWIPSNGKHRVKIGQDIDLTWSRSYSSANQYGSYAYQTLADLINNQPASYTLTLSSFDRSSRGTTGALWVGDEWNASKALQFQGGLRYDAAFPSTTPLENPAAAQEFGVNTARIPHSRLLTPRLGFSWTSPKRRGMGSSTGPGGPISLGSLPANLPPEFIQALLGTPRGSVAPGFAINGSVGGYGYILDNSSITGLIDQTGLANARRVLTCVGDATPIPDWSDPTEAAPSSCLDGTGASTFSANVPTIQVYDPKFKTQLSWRGNLGIDGIRLPRKWTLGVTGFYNYIVNRQSTLDLNLTRTPKFNLASEDNRPVYVTPDDIVPETGVIAPNAYRIDPSYGAVNDIVSDLHSYTAQLQASLAPPHPLWHNKLNLNFTYVYNYSRAEQRALGAGGFGGGNVVFISNGFTSYGFGGGGAYTAGDPFAKQWVAGTSPTHQIFTTATVRAWWFNLSLRLNVYSGTPFTPSVAGDVNGDGLNDDVAFIPNPATTSDPALAQQMSQLLASTPSGARACLEKQLGQLAGINSCTTQWQARLDVRVDWQPPRSFGLGDRLRITTQLQNTSGALVRLFGLENTALGRGALSTQANSQLLYVTGFNPTTQSYIYQVNQLFGQPLNFGTARHRYPPFQVQLGLEYKLGGPPRAPMASSMGLLPGKNEPPFTMDQIRAKLERLSRDPVQQILQRKDSLALTKDQVAKLDAISARFRAQSDSLLDPVLDYVMKKGRHIDDGELSGKLGKAQPQIQRLLIDAQTRSRALLTPAQLRMLPPPASTRPMGMAPGARTSGDGPMQGTTIMRIGPGGEL
jgi:hypothetical protein